MPHRAARGRARRAPGHRGVPAGRGAGGAGRALLTTQLPVRPGRRASIDAALEPAPSARPSPSVQADPRALNRRPRAARSPSRRRSGRARRGRWRLAPRRAQQSVLVLGLARGGRARARARRPAARRAPRAVPARGACARGVDRVGPGPRAARVRPDRARRRLRRGAPGGGLRCPAAAARRRRRRTRRRRRPRAGRRRRPAACGRRSPGGARRPTAPDRDRAARPTSRPADRRRGDASCAVAVGAVVSVRRRGLTQTSDRRRRPPPRSDTPARRGRGDARRRPRSCRPCCARLSRPAQERRGLVPVVATARASAAAGTALPLLTLTVAVALVVFCGTTVHTVDAGQSAAADARVGADVRVEGHADASRTSPSLRAQPGVTAVAGIAVLGGRALGEDSGTTRRPRPRRRRAARRHRARRTAGPPTTCDAWRPATPRSRRARQPLSSRRPSRSSSPRSGRTGRHPSRSTSSGRWATSRACARRHAAADRRPRPRRPCDVRRDPGRGDRPEHDPRRRPGRARRDPGAAARRPPAASTSPPATAGSPTGATLAAQPRPGPAPARHVASRSPRTPRSRSCSWSPRRRASAVARCPRCARSGSTRARRRALTFAELAPVAVAAVLGGHGDRRPDPLADVRRARARARDGWLRAARRCASAGGRSSAPLAVVAVALVVAVLVEGAVRRRDRLGEVLRVGER